jgi:hypothetical protein
MGIKKSKNISSLNEYIDDSIFNTPEVPSFLVVTQ